MKVTGKRKADHVEIVLSRGAQYAKGAGFDQVMLVHNALPELDFDKVSMETEFLGRKLEAPIVIEAMTGGYPEGGKINRKLAEAAEKGGAAFGLGSQRAMVEKPSLKETYAVRDVAPSVPIIANIGAFQLKKYPIERIESMVSAVDADALAVHLNPLQEMIQPEGDRDFSGILDALARACARLSVPVIAKETGAGIGREAAAMLKHVGVRYVDVAGAGGTSWSAIEYQRGRGIPGFAEWGIPTAACVIAVSSVIPTIASGGVRSGIDVAKSIALGAEAAGAAQPFLAAYEKGKLGHVLEEWKGQLKAAMFLTGSKNVAALRKAKVAVSQELKGLAAQV